MMVSEQDGQDSTDALARCRECTIVAETHHRIANHLAILSAQARVQARTLDDEVGRLQLQLLASHIDAAGRLHRLMLSGSSDADAAGHLHDICASYASALGDEIVLEEQFEPECRISPASILPVTQIVLEAMTNAFKYGRSANGVSFTRVTSQTAGSRVRFVVSDSGPGLPSDEPAAGHGMRLIQTLARQIGADVSFASMDGFHVILSVPRA